MWLAYVILYYVLLSKFRIIIIIIIFFRKITWDLRADYSSYSVTTYIKTKPTWSMRKKKENKRKRMKEN